MNERGHPQTLEARHPGNANALRHGAYSGRRSLPPEAVEIADSLMQAPHVVDLDRYGAEEIAALVVQIDRIDAALADGRVERNDRPRALIDLRARLSGRLERWLAAYGLTPASRAEWAARLASGGLAGEIARRQRIARGETP